MNLYENWSKYIPAGGQVVAADEVVKGAARRANEQGSKSTSRNPLFTHAI